MHAGVVLSQVLAMPCARPFNPEVADYSSILPSVHPSINTSGSTGSSTAAMVPTHPAVTNNTITDRHDIVESNLVSRGVEAGRLIMSAASAFGLEECWLWKPLLDGKQVMPILGLQKPGPELGPALAAVMEWQLTHPLGTADECKEFLVKHFAPSKQ
ncbi:hypothetical protein CEUSTIGMA_g7837.t1 [Chlamydomonas eustigma]|uniref:CCA-adding enzyme C-terminal domain-containing protein n=1 Tax=Chlamydomonas eustigma TaxID=1157962 RepID=A0A250XBE4_9CHLO|nr:hypothetical protein CEUSTIGMA_g7837.t1 [Chlamydomonas eustigma]|eukprot:GAX80398.1 hypothetical protein CEUSTIGMA_g7837.t1 [Chlamydomonas eustigma]